MFQPGKTRAEQNPVLNPSTAALSRQGAKTVLTYTEKTQTGLKTNTP